MTKIANTLEEPVVQRLVRMLKKGNDERTQERVGDASNVYFSTNTDKESIGVHSTHHSFTSLPQQVQVEIPSDVQKQIQQEQVQLRSAPSPQISHVRQRVHEQFAWRRGPCNDEAQKENDESTQLSNGVVASTRVKTSITATPKNGCIRSENQCVSTSESAASVGRNYDIKKQTDATQSKASPVVSLPISQPPSDGATGPTSRSVLTFQPSDLQGFSPFPLQTQVHTPLISASNPSSASYSSSLRPHSLSSLHQLSQQTLASHSLSSSSSTALQNSFADKLYQMQRQYQKRLHSIQRYHQEQQQVQQPRGAQQGFPTPVAHVNHSHKVSDDYLSSVFRRHRQHQSLRQSRRTGDAGSKETNQAALSMQTAVANMNKGLRNNNTSRYVDASAILDAGVSTTCDAKSSAGAGDVERAVGQPDITVMQRISSSLLHRAQHPRQDHQRIDETISDGQKKYEEASTGPGKASDAVSVKYEAFHIHSGGDDKIMSSVDGARVAKEATDNQDDHRSTLSTFSSLSPPPPSRAAPEVANANEAARSIDNCAVPSPSSIPSPATSSSMPTESEAKPPIGMQTAAQTQAGQGELIVPIHLPSPNRRRSLKREGCRRRYKSDAEGVLHALAPSHFSVPRSSKSGDDASENGMLRFVVSNESGVEASPSRQYRSLLRTPYSVSPVHSPFVTSPERRNEYFFDQPLSVDGEADDFLKNTSTERSVHVKAGTRNDSSPAMGDEEDRKEVGETTSCSGSTYDDGDTMPINSGTVSSGVDDKSAAKDNKSK